MSAKAILFTTTIMLMAFSACSSKERAAPTESASGDPAGVTEASAPEADAATPQQESVQGNLNITMYVNAEARLRVRSAPGTEGEILGSLEHMTQVNVTAVSDNVVTIGDFPEFTRWLDIRDSLIPIPELEIELF